MPKVRDLIPAPVSARINGEVKNGLPSELFEFQAAISKTIGTTGLTVFGGYITEAYVQDLYWPGAYDVYNDMRRRVPSLRTLLNAIFLLSRGVTWKFEAANEDKEQAAAVDFGDEVLDDMGTAFGQFVEDALSAIPFGFSWHEPEWGRRSPTWRPGGDDDWRSHYTDNKIGLRRLGFRRQSTFDRWEISEATGRLKGMWQNDPPNPRVLLPLREKNVVRSLHFIPFRDGDNPEGLSLFESCYESYYNLKNYSVILGVGMERSLVGWPVFEFESTPGATDKALLQSAVNSLLAGSEKGFISLPAGIKMRFENITNANAPTLLEIIKFLNLQMLQTVLADFIWLGAGETGSWSLGSDKSTLFIMGVNGLLDRLAEAFNESVGMQLYRFYDPNLQTPPKLTHTQIHKPVPLSDLATLVSTLSQIIPLSEDDILNIRARTDGLLAAEQGKPFEGLLNKKEPVPQKQEPEESIPEGEAEGEKEVGGEEEEPEEEETELSDNAREWLSEFVRMSEPEQLAVLKEIHVSDSVS